MIYRRAIGRQQRALIVGDNERFPFLENWWIANIYKRELMSYAKVSFYGLNFCQTYLTRETFVTNKIFRNLFSLNGRY